ncbi:tetratricopeptide repeat protein [Chloroflexota bacterium]
MYGDFFSNLLDDFDEVLEMNPANAVILTASGDIHRELKEYDEAISDYTAALEVQNRAAERDFAEQSATATAEAKMGSGPSYFVYLHVEVVGRPCLYNNRALAYSSLGRHDDAFADINMAIEMDSDYDLFYLNRGNFYHETGNYQDAIHDYDKAIELGMTYAEVFYVRARSKSALGYNGRAIEDLNIALNSNPQLNEPSKFFSICYQERGDIHQRMGKKAQALRDYKQALEYTDDQESQSYLERKIGELENEE